MQQLKTAGRHQQQLTPAENASRLREVLQGNKTHLPLPVYQSLFLLIAQGAIQTVAQLIAAQAGPESWQLNHLAARTKLHSGKSPPRFPVIQPPAEPRPPERVFMSGHRQRGSQAESGWSIPESDYRGPSNYAEHGLRRPTPAYDTHTQTRNPGGRAYNHRQRLGNATRHHPAMMPQRAHGHPQRQQANRRAPVGGGSHAHDEDGEDCGGDTACTIA